MNISHPHAQTALQLAGLKWPKRDHISLVLSETGTPRHLYTLARILRAATQMEQMDAADAGRRLRAASAAKHAADSTALRDRFAPGRLRAAIDAKHADDSAALGERLAQVLQMTEIDRAMPRTRYDANAFGPGLAGILVDHAGAA